MDSDLKAPRHVLIVEDSDGKWKEIKRVMDAGWGSVRLQRAPTMADAYNQLARGIWSLLLLDISMNVRASSAGRRAGGHDTTGGLKIAQRMYFLEQDVPTVIVTAFDAFPGDPSKRGAVLGLEDVVREASELLGSSLIGCVRYGDPDWEDLLRDAVKKVLG